jgi:hypothetical protein
VDAPLLQVLVLSRPRSLITFLWHLLYAAEPDMEDLLPLFEPWLVRLFGCVEAWLPKVAPALQQLSGGPSAAAGEAAVKALLQLLPAAWLFYYQLLLLQQEQRAAAVGWQGLSDSDEERPAAAAAADKEAAEAAAKSVRQAIIRQALRWMRGLVQLGQQAGRLPRLGPAWLGCVQGVIQALDDDADVVPQVRRL